MPGFPGLQGDWHEGRKNCLCVNSITQLQIEQIKPEGRKGYLCDPPSHPPAAHSPWKGFGWEKNAGHEQKAKRTASAGKHRVA